LLDVDAPDPFDGFLHGCHSSLHSRIGRQIASGMPMRSQF
jgi:hypothetical protein